MCWQAYNPRRMKDESNRRTGNPGSKYKETKHNIGFITLDEIAYRQNVSFNNSNFEADIAEFL